MKDMEERILKSLKVSTNPQPSARVDTQAREHALQTMAKDLEAKFVFVMGAATKAKKLPHMSKIRKLKGEEPDTENTNSQSPVDILDILLAYSYKIENLRNKIRYIEQLETSTSTTNTTKIVSAIL
jgi:nitrate reductase NapAB chaperone NapD